MKAMDNTEQDNKAENWVMYQQVPHFLKQEKFWLTLSLLAHFIHRSDWIKFAQQSVST